MVFERNCLLALLGIALVAPVLLQNQYALHIGVLIMFSVMLATSFNLIVGYVGEFSLGHTALLGVGAYTVALLSTRFGLPFHFAVLAAAVVAGLFGLLIGAITLRLRGPFFVIVTLCFAEVLRLIANNWIGLTNGPMGISGIEKPAWAAGDALQQKLAYYYAGLVLAAVSLYVAYRFVYSNVGRAAIAVRENRFVAQSVGISPFHFGLLTFVLAASIAGLAGGFYANYVTFVGPEVFGFSFMITMIIMVLAGGKGTLLGPVTGAVLVVLLEEFLRDFKELRFSIFGLIVIAVVLFLPRGIMGFIAKRHELRRPRVSSNA
jgi:branched-chain amino acid transport system permease protein